jgi:hypothetical protein
MVDKKVYTKQEKKELQNRIQDYADTLWESDIQDFKSYIAKLNIDDKFTYITEQEEKLRKERDIERKSLKNSTGFPLWTYQRLDNLVAWTTSSSTPTREYSPDYFYEWICKGKTYRLQFRCNSNTKNRDRVKINIVVFLEYWYLKLTRKLPDKSY